LFIRFNGTNYGLPNPQLQLNTGNWAPRVIQNCYRNTVRGRLGERDDPPGQQT
jgi:hypothetical protein